MSNHAIVAWLVILSAVTGLLVLETVALLVTAFRMARRERRQEGEI